MKITYAAVIFNYDHARLGPDCSVTVSRAFRRHCDANTWLCDAESIREEAYELAREGLFDNEGVPAAETFKVERIIEERLDLT